VAVVVRRLENGEMVAALAELERRVHRSHGAERDRLISHMAAMNANHPDWALVWTDHTGTAVHLVPGPRMLELLMPSASIGLPIGGHVHDTRWRRIVTHLRAVLREVLGR
jgi:hypothetical protein